MNLFKSLSLAFKGGGGRPALSRYGGGAGVIPTYAEGVSSGDEAPFSYTRDVEAAYERNPVAQRAVRIVTEGIAGAPLAVSDDRIRALVSAASAGQPLLETIAAHLLLHGNAYVQVARGGDGMPAGLYALRPDRVTVEVDVQGWPAAFTYRAGENHTRFDAETPDGYPQVIHIKGFHPSDDHYGLGCLGAAAGAVAAHNAAARWNAALLGNAARPSGALVHDGGEGGMPLSPEQFDRLRAELTATFSGARNAGRPMVLEGGLKWQPISLSPADMDFVALKAAAARDIALAFGVPPMLLGLPGDNSYANYREANRALWRLTLLPLSGKILDALAEGLRGWWPDAALSVDLDKITALAEDRERLWKQVNAAEFLSDQEKRNILGVK
ncbi:phage portal protein [Sphingorhabdus sp. Alg239-R122]|uniref:phage portal protein n=1 Tax=Sphingorhabdus sp. Alg239-R122 TaxID=2305989 RepID=UPI0013DB15DC|nr:phage portal protein [Sphingorhabdus sp. Alg239-R122]